jgi:hypothetical protein
MKQLSLMAWLICAAFAPLAFGGVDEAGKTRLYGRRGVVETNARVKPTSAGDSYGGVMSPKETAGELARWLRQMSGVKVEIDAVSTSMDNRAGAICLLRADSTLVAAADRNRLLVETLGRPAAKRPSDSLKLWMNAYAWLGRASAQPLDTRVQMVGRSCLESSQ